MSTQNMIDMIADYFKTRFESMAFWLVCER